MSGYNIEQIPLPVIHLDTGVRVCGLPRSWCRAEFQIDHSAERRLVLNGTANRATSTCPACNAAYDVALDALQSVKP